MEIFDVTYKNKKEIETKTEKDSQEISAMCATAATINVAQCLDSKNITLTKNQGNNAAIVEKNMFFSSKRRRRKRKAFSNFAFNFLPSTTMPQAVASTSIGVKRPQNLVDGPVVYSEVTKKLKISDERTQAINDSLTTALVSTNNMSLGSEQLTLLRGAISKGIDKAVDSFVPKFYDSYIKFGAIVVRCVDEASLRWLSMQIGNISPWPQVELKMIALSELQRYFRACVWIPGPLEPTETVLMRLNQQNPDLNTTKWQIFAENLGASEDGRSLFLGVPDSDFKKLQASNFRAYLGLGQVHFVFSHIRQQSSVAADSWYLAVF